MFELLNSDPRLAVAMAAFVLGLGFGFIAERTHFCTMGGLSDAVLMNDFTRLRSWMLAVAVALIGTQALAHFGFIDLSRSIYLGGKLNALGAVLGGGLFGYGMVLAGGCGNKVLVRLGTGNLKSLLVFLIIALVAGMSLKGLLAVPRVEFEAATNLGAAMSLDGLLVKMGLGADVARWLAVAVIGGGLLVWVFKDLSFVRQTPHVMAGILIGLIIPLGWAASGVLGADDFDPQPLHSFSFVAPIADTQQYFVTFTGAAIGFGVASVLGVVLGAFVSGLLGKRIRLEGFADRSDLVRHLIGAAMMGLGGVLALGCTIGQGLTGISTLSLASFLALGGICFGGVWALKALEEDGVWPGLRAMFGR